MNGRLNDETARGLPAQVRRPAYERHAQAIGIVHLGLGAFHRAHQAVYTEDAMDAGDRDWRILGVSLRSAGVRDALQPQDGLYTVTERSSVATRRRLIGALSGALVAPEDPEALIVALASPATHIVSLTVTEKGYARDRDGALDAADPNVAADLAGEGAPRTIYGYLAAGLVRRRAARLPGLTLLSCDNLADNGATLRRLLLEFLEAKDADLARWFAATCACPATMVDRIVPATTAGDLDEVEAILGLRDEAAVVTEGFRQWVIEDRFAGPRPRWEVGGAQLVEDVAAYEAAKLRMLNGAHSALAYLGLLHGHTYVHEAIADPALRALVERLMREEAAASIAPAAGQDLDRYAHALLERFANPSLKHRLGQIAMDGSQKIPQRWLSVLRDRQAARARCPAILTALAAWLLHLRGESGPVSDPQGEALGALWRTLGRDDIGGALFGRGGRFSGAWTASPQDAALLKAALRDLERRELVIPA